MPQIYNYYVINDGTTAWVGDWSDAYDNYDEYGIEVVGGYNDINIANKIAESINAEMLDVSYER